MKSIFFLGFKDSKNGPNQVRSKANIFWILLGSQAIKKKSFQQTRPFKFSKMMQINLARLDFTVHFIVISSMTPTVKENNNVVTFVRCDVLGEGVKEQLKIQDAKATQLSSYQETLQSTLAWLEAMERNLDQDSVASLTAPQEIRTRLIKYRVRR